MEYRTKAVTPLMLRQQTSELSVSAAFSKPHHMQSVSDQDSTAATQWDDLYGPDVSGILHELITKDEAVQSGPRPNGGVWLRVPPLWGNEEVAAMKIIKGAVRRFIMINRALEYPKGGHAAGNCWDGTL